MSTAPPAVLLDLDGTLVDSNYLHVLAWARAFRRTGRRVPLAAIHACIGMGADLILERLAGGPDEGVERRWREEFERLRDEVVPTPGAVELVRTLCQRGATVVYATSGHRHDVEALCATIGADEWVAAVVNAGDVDTSKPAPDIFRLALERAGVGPDRAAVVGDTVWDVRAARACGLPCVAVTTGGISASVLLEAGASAAYETPAALVAGLDDSPLAPLLPAPA